VTDDGPPAKVAKASAPAAPATKAKVTATAATEVRALCIGVTLDASRVQEHVIALVVTTLSVSLHLLCNSTVQGCVTSTV
jgi:hypothetical protein